MSVPRAASFAVSFRVGSTDQLKLALPDANFGERVVDEVVTCFTLLEHSPEELKERIKDESYYDNFVGLAQRIAPDGQKIRTVGLTWTRGEDERRLSLSPRGSFPRAKGEGAEETVTLVGYLRRADATGKKQGSIDLVTKDGTERVKVPIGLMADIVRPLFDARVSVTARKKGKTLLLRAVEEVD